jgi:hypothetical protein
LYGRLLLIFEAGIRDGQFVPWRQDRGIQQILSSVLDAEAYSTLIAGSFGGWFSTCELVEAKLVAEIRAVISGEHAADTGLAAATRILNAVQTAPQLNAGKITR